MIYLIIYKIMMMIILIKKMKIKMILAKNIMINKKKEKG